jgi:hypothetical protein
MKKENLEAAKALCQQIESRERLLSDIEELIVIDTQKVNGEVSLLRHRVHIPDAYDSITRDYMSRLCGRIRVEINTLTIDLDKL